MEHDLDLIHFGNVGLSSSDGSYHVYVWDVRETSRQRVCDLIQEDINNPEHPLTAFQGELLIEDVVTNYADDAIQE